MKQSSIILLNVTIITQPPYQYAVGLATSRGTRRLILELDYEPTQLTSVVLTFIDLGFLR